MHSQLPPFLVIFSKCYEIKNVKPFLCLWFTVPVLEQPTEADRLTSFRLEPLTVVLIICVVVLSATAIILASILCRRRHTAEQRLVVVDEDHDSSASLRTRLSPLHSNLLHAVTSDDDKVKSREGQNGRLLVNGAPTNMNIDSLEEFSVLGETALDGLESVDGRFLEVHNKMMSGTVRRRVDEPTQNVSEYEIPLDPQWEFPRDRSVCSGLMFTSC